MKLLIISSVAALALLASAAGTASIHKSRSLSTPVETAGMPTMQELNIAAGVDKLPVEEFDDRSLIFPRETNQ
jgi:hypothetical protein